MSSSEDVDMVKQVSSVFERHIRLYERLNAIKKAANLEDDRKLSQARAILEKFALWLADLRTSLKAPKA